MDGLLRYYGNDNSSLNVPIMLGEILHIFASVHLHSFIDCTLNAASHSSAVCVSAIFVVINISFFLSISFKFGEIIDICLLGVLIHEK